MRNNKIKWGRLKDICSRLIDREVVLVASYGDAASDVLRGGIKIEKGGSVTIYLNLFLNKSLKSIIKTLAHELAHYKEQSESEDSDVFKKTMSDIESDITNQYNKKGGK